MAASQELATCQAWAPAQLRTQPCSVTVGELLCLSASVAAAMTGGGDHSQTLLTVVTQRVALPPVPGYLPETQLEKRAVHVGETCKTSSRSSLEVEPLGNGAMGVADQAMATLEIASEITGVIKYDLKCLGDCARRCRGSSHSAPPYRNRTEVQLTS